MRSLPSYRYQMMESTVECDKMVLQKQICRVCTMHKTIVRCLGDTCTFIRMVLLKYWIGNERMAFF